MRVRFSAVEEFLDELTQDAHLVEEGIIRVTLNYQPLEMKPLMRLAVRAGVIVNGKIVELHQTIGHVWSPPAGGLSRMRQGSSSRRSWRRGSVCWETVQRRASTYPNSSMAIYAEICCKMIVVNMLSAEVS